MSLWKFGDFETDVDFTDAGFFRRNRGCESSNV